MPCVNGLQLEGLSKAFHGLSAVSIVSIECSPGEVVGIGGPNGSGKTTLLNLITGNLQADSGRIVYGRADITHSSVTRRVSLGIARTYQEGRILPNHTVMENVLLGASHFRRSPWWAIPQLENRGRASLLWVTSALDQVELSGMESRLAGELSFGQRKRLEFATVLVRTAGEASLLLLDEPTSGGDMGFKKFLAERILKLRDDGRCILIVEHDLEFLRLLSTRLLILVEGKIYAEGQPEEVLARSDVRGIYVGSRLNGS